MRCTLLLLVLLGTACARDFVTESTSLWRARDVVSERTFLPAAFDTVWRIGGSADTTFLNPVRLDAGPEGVTVWDDGRRAIIRVSPEGNVAWSFGRDGEGPGEFRLVRTIAHLAGGGAAAVDNMTMRLTVVDAIGQMTGVASIGGAVNPFSVAGLPNGGVVVFVESLGDPPTPSFLFFDKTGAPAGSLDFPWERFHDIPLIARQGRVQGTADGWVFGFTAGNGWWSFEENGDAERFPYAEHTEFPAIRTYVDGRGRLVRMEPVVMSYVTSARSFGARGDTLFVHFNGSSASARLRALDLFSVGVGNYLGTVVLPSRVVEVAIGPDVIYTLHFNPYPVLTALRYE